MGTEKMDAALEAIEQHALKQLHLFGSCAQGTLAGLQQYFGLESDLALKAATAMPGIALRGETCGAVIGAGMALGMVLGRKQPEDDAALLAAIRATRKVCDAFEARFGSCRCCRIHQHLFGRSYDLYKAEDQLAFARDKADQKCQEPVRLAARTAGRLILSAKD